MAKITRIAPELPAVNLQAALEYYEHKLGFRVAMQLPASDYAIVERDGVAIHLFQDVSEKNGVARLHQSGFMYSRRISMRCTPNSSGAALT